MIRLAPDFMLPLDLLTQAIGILAQRRAGKSYTARRLVEQLLKYQSQVVIVDPKGDWWGIRSSADGKREGYPVLILGGEHGDVPLEVAGGELVARLVVEERVSVLLDLSLFRKGEVSAFMAAFLENLYRLKAREAYRTPAMLVIDEADAIAPQKPQPDQARMLGAAEDIVRRGGQRGIGCTMITQRSAVLNKNVLTQIGVLIALRTMAPQDLKAISEWVDVHGTEDGKKQLLSSLPSLQTGNAWVWSPGWPDADGLFDCVKVSPIETFDSGATPKAGAKPAKPKMLADVDLDSVRKLMAGVVERAEASDPRKLQRKIAELQKELSAKQKAAPKDLSGELEQARMEVHRLRTEVANANVRLERIGGHAAAAMDAIAKVSDGAKLRLAPDTGGVAVPKSMLKRMSVHDAVNQVRADEARALLSQPARSQPAPPAPRAPVKEPSGGETRMLQALAQSHPAGLTEAQWAVLSKLKRTGGTWGTYKSRLRGRGHVEERGDLFFATDEGVEAAGVVPAAPQGRDEILEMWRSKPGMGPAVRVVEAALKLPDPFEGGDGIPREDLAEAAGLTEGAGTFGSYLSRAKTAGLLDVRDGRVYLASILE